MLEQDAQAGIGGGRDGGLPAGLIAEVHALIEMMARGGIADLTLETTAVKLRLRAYTSTSRTATDAPRFNPVIPGGALEPAPPEGIIITAPMIGTFYHAPAPGEPPFVAVGDPVERGQTIGIIEAMKIMNEISAESSGTVAEFLVANGQPVEYGQPLLRLDPLPGA